MIPKAKRPKIAKSGLNARKRGAKDPDFSDKTPKKKHKRKDSEIKEE